MTGTPRPQGVTLDGESIVPLLRRTGRLTRDALHWHFPAYLEGYTERHGPFRTTPAASIRVGDYKLIEFFEDGTRELYNLADDIGEERNLADAMPERVRDLHRRMLAWREKVAAPVPTKPNPKYDPTATQTSRRNRRGSR
jgi:arylsulfatase A-like enzyme